MAALKILEPASKLAERSVESAHAAEPEMEASSVSEAATSRQSETDRPTTLVADFQFSPALELKPGSWKTSLTSVAVHAAVIILLLILVVPDVQKLPERVTHFVLLSPRLQPYRAKLTKAIQLDTPPVPKRLKLNAVLVKPKLPPKPKLVEPPKILPQLPAEVAANQPRIELPKPEPPPAPKVELKQPPKPTPIEMPVLVGRFGDPQGVPVNTQAHAAPNLPRVGSFDASDASQHGSAGARSVVQTSGFGDLEGAAGASPHAGRTLASVRTGGFVEADPREMGTGRSRTTNPPAKANAPAEILFKPKPVYSAEARQLKIEGQVALDVILEASGKVRVLQVLHALGHGLDEAADKAAMQIRFRPATKDGIPVDTRATLYITFQLT
jgi:TonB family protein